MKNSNTKKNTTVASSNPFAAFAAEPSTSSVRRLDYTPALQSISRERAVALVGTKNMTPEQAAQANKMLDGQPQDLIELIGMFYDAETIKADAAVLDGASDDVLGRMLESQRSNRSKAKKTGLRTNITAVVTYVTSMYAEMLIRSVTGKAYAGATQAITEDLSVLKADPAARDRKIASLASKKSRLSKLAQYDEAAANELVEVETMLAELRSYKAKSTTVVRSATTKELKQAVAKLSADELESLPENVRELLSKLA